MLSYFKQPSKESGLKLLSFYIVTIQTHSELLKMKS